MEGNYYTDKSNVKKNMHAYLLALASMLKLLLADAYWFCTALSLYGHLKRVKEWVLVVTVEDLEGD